MALESDAPAVTSGADLTRLELHPGDYRKLALSQETGYSWEQSRLQVPARRAGTDECGD